MSKKAADDAAVIRVCYLGVKSHKESVGIVLHAGGGPANSKLPGNNGAAALEHRDLRRRQKSFILNARREEGKYKLLKDEEGL